MLLVLLLALFLQGVPALTTDAGSVTGTLRHTDGAPAAAVRIAAVAPPQPGEPDAAEVMISIAETDENGRFHMDNVPPGQYYIAAGRVDFPTYYPGVVESADRAAVTVAAGADVAGIDFVLNVDSIGRTTVAGSLSILLIPPGFTIPVTINVENGGKIPYSAGGLVPSLRLTPIPEGAPVRISLNTPQITIPIPDGTGPDRYRVEIDNVPAGYSVRAITYAAADVLDGGLEISSRHVAAATPSILSTIRPEPAVLSASDMRIVLTGPPPAASTSGVRVTGNFSGPAAALYLSGSPGVLYTDGTFEFRDVPPGRHTIVKIDSGPPGNGWYVGIVVGNSDLDGIGLHPVSVLPIDTLTPAPPQPAPDHIAGTAFAPVSLRGQVFGDAGNPVNPGTIVLTGYLGSRRVYALDRIGRFEFPRLAPGRYELEIAANGYATLSRTIVVGYDPVELTLTMSR